MLRVFYGHLCARTPALYRPTVRFYQKGLHPRTYDLKIVMSDGSMFKVRSSIRKDFLKLAEDTKNVKPWKHGKDQTLLDSQGTIAGFSRKFGNMFKA